MDDPSYPSEQEENGGEIQEPIERNFSDFVDDVQSEEGGVKADQDEECETPDSSLYMPLGGSPS